MSTETPLAFVVTSGVRAPAAQVRPAARAGRRRWSRGRHDRLVVQDGVGARVIDRIHFVPVLAAGGWLEWGVRRALVGARHAWLVRRFGARPLDFVLETERLHLRPWTSADRAAFGRLASDPVVMRFIGDGRTWSDAEVDGFLARQRAHLRRCGFCLGVIVERASGEPIGLGGLQPLGTTTDVEVGWWLRPSRWGEGLATEIGRAALRFAFETAGLERVVAIAHPENVRSRRVMERLGMAPLAPVSRAALGLGVPDRPVVRYLLESPMQADAMGV